jgi:pilus assembly protein CpaC
MPPVSQVRTLYLFIFKIISSLIFNLFLAVSVSVQSAPVESKSKKVSERVILVGDEVLIRGPQKITVGVQDILELTALTDGTRILGKRPGQTLLKLGDQYQQIQVLRFSQFQTFERLQNFTKGSLALKAELQLGKVHLSGTLQSLQELIRLEKLCRDDLCDFVASFTIPDHLREGFQDTIRNLLKEHSVLAHQIIWEPHLRLLVPPNLQNLASLQKSFARLGLEVEPHSQVLDLAPSLELQLMILEVRKNSFERYGISWPQSYSAQVLPSYQQIDELILSAQFLEAGGLGRVLASPIILARSGEEAEFLAGGEIPIRVSGYRAQDVIWKRYGILMKINAKVDLAQKMSIKIETEISSLDRSVTVDGVPGFKTNRVKSHFDLSGPKTLALSGLIRAEEAEAQEGLLGLQHLPILGRLFSSREFQRQQTELMILVRPRVPDRL